MSDIKPAMTPEDWRGWIGPWEEWEDQPLHPLPLKPGDFLEAYGSQPEAWHRGAAQFLYGQPFGFTWEDVEKIRGMVRAQGPNEPYFGAWLNLADRIAALLPPRESPVSR